VNPINGDWERMDATAARTLCPPNVRVIADPAPDGAIREALSTILS